MDEHRKPIERLGREMAEALARGDEQALHDKLAGVQEHAEQDQLAEGAG